MAIRHKSPETLQAQVAAFATERINDKRDYQHTMHGIGRIAAGETTDITRTTTTVELRRQENGDVQPLPAGSDLAVATKEDYLNYLRSRGGASHENIKVRADMLSAYSHFQPLIAELKTELAETPPGTQHLSVLGEGLSSVAFSLKDGDKQYAVRVPKGKKVDAIAINGHIAGGVLGKGIPHLEQIVAASYEDGVTVAEMMPGKELGKLSVEDINTIQDDQLATLVDTVVTANHRGIEIDTKPSNILYDPQEGFGFVDYHSSQVASKSSENQNAGMILSEIGFRLGNLGSSAGKAPETIDDYAHDLKYLIASVEVVQRYRQIVESRQVGNELGEALRLIDDRIANEKTMVAQWSNPEWVTEQIAKAERRKKERIAQRESNSQLLDEI